MQGRRCLRKNTIGPMLQDVVSTNPEIGAVEFFSWSGARAWIPLLIRWLSDPPGGVELICQWSANDVYGNFGYMEYTWHLTGQAEAASGAWHREIDPATQESQSPRPDGCFFNLPQESDDEMRRCAKLV